MRTCSQMAFQVKRRGPGYFSWDSSFSWHRVPDKDHIMAIWRSKVLVIAPGSNPS